MRRVLLPLQRLAFAHWLRPEHLLRQRHLQQRRAALQQHQVPFLPLAMVPHLRRRQHLHALLAPPAAALLRRPLLLLPAAPQHPLHPLVEAAVLLVPPPAPRPRPRARARAPAPASCPCALTSAAQAGAAPAATGTRMRTETARMTGKRMTLKATMRMMTARRRMMARACLTSCPSHPTKARAMTAMGTVTATATRTAPPVVPWPSWSSSPPAWRRRSTPLALAPAAVAPLHRLLLAGVGVKAGAETGMTAL